ncbi:MAG TPA: FeoB small GTPase domain-containing protein, partial [Ignavibacteriales bacterium]|nr:FeoB small GTPase domain-containing protein [Ignavibacteriales bacterium]
MKSDAFFKNAGHSHGSHDTYTDTVETAQEKKKLVLVGNPNVGKSLFFNFLSGMYVDVSNFPGTTISITRGSYKNYNIYDTPGIYGVSSFNDEEKVARDIILESDVVLNVVNSLHLERDLFLTQQLIEMGKKVVVALNFSDELSKRNIKINVKRLSEMLGVEVIETSAVKKLGFEKIEPALANAREGKIHPEILSLLDGYLDKTVSQADALMILEGDEFVAARYGVPQGGPSERELVYIS